MSKLTHEQARMLVEILAEDLYISENFKEQAAINFANIKIAAQVAAEMSVFRKGSKTEDDNGKVN